MIDIAGVGIYNRHTGGVRADTKTYVIINAVPVPVIVDGIADPHIRVGGRHE